MKIHNDGNTSALIRLGDSREELMKNIYEAVEACLSVDLKTIQLKEADKVIEVAV